MTPFDGLQWRAEVVPVVGAQILSVSTANTAATVTESLTASGGDKYNPEMVARLLRAKKGRVKAVPSDEASFIKWLRRA